MRRVFGALKFLFFSRGEERRYHGKIASIIGYYPLSFILYEQAFRHLSASERGVGGEKTSNERLEYLGDAVLDLTIAELLYRKFPFKGEGFLTEMKSRIVSRKQLAKLAREIGIHEVLKTDKNVSASSHVMNSLSGNALEAMIGAIYLDMGYSFTFNFVYQRLIKPFIILDEIEKLNENYKSILNQWAQKERKVIEFRIVDENGKNHERKFTIALIIDGDELARATHFSKKTAEKIAAQMVCEKLSLN